MIEIKVLCDTFEEAQMIDIIFEQGKINLGHFKDEIDQNVKDGKIDPKFAVVFSKRQSGESLIEECKQEEEPVDDIHHVFCESE